MSLGGECCNRDFSSGIRYAESRSVELSFHRHPIHPRFRSRPGGLRQRCGTVVDPSGAAVPNAKVIISDTSRALTFTTTTNESGFFTQRFLIAGTYQVRVEAGSFRAHVQDVSVSVDQETSLDIKLQLGDLSGRSR